MAVEDVGTRDSLPKWMRVSFAIASLVLGFSGVALNILAVVVFRRREPSTANQESFPLDFAKSCFSSTFQSFQCIGVHKYTRTHIQVYVCIL